jgi:hypothetical protein
MSRVCLWLLGLGPLWACTGDAVPDRLRVEVGFEDVEVLHDSEVLYRIRDLHVEAGGRVWVLSARPPYVYVIENGSTVPFSFGRQGGGPTEFGTPWSLVAGIEPGSMGIWDVGRRRVLYYRVDGGTARFDSAVAVTGPTASMLEEMELTAYGTPLRMSRAGSRLVWQPAERPLLRPADMQDLLLLSASQAAGPWRTIYTSTAGARSQAEYLVAVPLWTACASGALHVLEPPATLLSVAPDGDVVDTARLPLKDRILNDGDLRTFLQHAIEVELRGMQAPPEQVIRARIDETLRDGRYLFPEKAASVTRLLCDDSGRVWLQLFSTADDPVGFSREWLVWSEGGELAEVVFPAAFRPLAITGRRVYGALRDAWDVERPAMWRMIRDLTDTLDYRGVSVGPVQ